jgi:hypothetical protein
MSTNGDFHGNPDIFKAYAEALADLKAERLRNEILQEKLTAARAWSVTRAAMMLLLVGCALILFAYILA